MDLATRAYVLVDRHLKYLDRDIARLEKSVKTRGKAAVVRMKKGATGVGGSWGSSSSSSSSSSSTILQRHQQRKLLSHNNNHY